MSRRVLSARSGEGRRRDRSPRPLVVELESRQLLATNPLDSAFQSAFQSLLVSDKIPEGTVSVIRDGQDFTYGATNDSYFGSGTAPPAPTDDSLFRLGSVSKTFTATAILKLVQDGKFALTDSALTVLNYAKGQAISGNDPVTGEAVSATIPDALFDITVENLLQMTSGLVYDIPLASGEYRYAVPGNLTANEGSYAALGFAGATGNPATFTAPASMSQLIRYMFFEIGKNPNLIAAAPGEMQFYNNMNYGILGEIVALKGGATGSTPQERYFNYLDQNILEPLGIAVAGAGTPTAAMVGLGATFKGFGYPTEVSYYPTTLATSILPATMPNPLGLPVSSGQVELPYGGDRDLSTNFANGGLVATPTAVSILMNNLSGVYEGTATGPLSQATVRAMIAPPVAPSTGKAPTGSAFGDGGALPSDEPGDGYFAMGLDVTPHGSGSPTWAKDGAIAGASAFSQRFPDGTIYTAIFNIESDSIIPNFKSLIASTLFKRPVATVESFEVDPAAPVALVVTANDTDPNPGGMINPTSLRFVDLPKHGKVSQDPNNGIVVYVPAADFLGTDDFSYTIEDNYGLTSEAGTVTITVRTPPVVPTPPPIVITVPVPTFLPATARIAYADLDGDGRADTIAEIGPRRHPRIAVYDGATGALITGLLPYGRHRINGPVYFGVAAANHGAGADIVAWRGGRRGIHDIRAFDGRTFARIRKPFRPELASLIGRA